MPYFHLPFMSVSVLCVCSHDIVSSHTLNDCALGVQLKLMTSWAVVCDVYFLPPQTKGKDESAQQFAERVQKLIAQRAKLHVAPWDGYLKYYNLGDKVRCFSFPSSLLFVFCAEACFSTNRKERREICLL